MLIHPFRETAMNEVFLLEDLTQIFALCRRSTTVDCRVNPSRCSSSPDVDLSYRGHNFPRHLRLSPENLYS